MPTQCPKDRLKSKTRDKVARTQRKLECNGREVVEKVTISLMNARNGVEVPLIRHYLSVSCLRRVRAKRIQCVFKAVVISVVASEYLAILSTIKNIFQVDFFVIISYIAW